MKFKSQREEDIINRYCTKNMWLIILISFLFWIILAYIAFSVYISPIFFLIIAGISMLGMSITIIWMPETQVLLKMLFAHYSSTKVNYSEFDNWPKKNKLKKYYVRQQYLETIFLLDGINNWQLFGSNPYGQGNVKFKNDLLTYTTVLGKSKIPEMSAIVSALGELGISKESIKIRQRTQLTYDAIICLKLPDKLDSKILSAPYFEEI